MILRLSLRQARSVISILTLVVFGILIGGLRFATAGSDFPAHGPSALTRLPPALLYPLIAAPVLLRLLDDP